ncbi:MAG: hypothetical protein ACLFVG_00580 [Candidatus Aminicenantes bacterium]
MDEKKIGKRNRYFQTVTRHFIKQRGTPFFLSSQELDLIDRWEKKGIPLRVVLEGIKRSFEDSRTKRRKREKIFSLLYCDFQVLKAFGQYKERRVGKRGLIFEGEEKRKKARAEVVRFLRRLPSPVGFLGDLYSEAQEMLSKREWEEEELEQLEERIEELLWEDAPQEMKEKVRKEVMKEYEYRDEYELDSMLKIRLVKFMRERYKIPHISLFYY